MQHAGEVPPGYPRTRLVPFRRPDRDDGGGSGSGTFDLLGFTHHWASSRNDKWVVKKRTAKDRFSRTLRRIGGWCRMNRHFDGEEQHRVISQKLHGHYALLRRHIEQRRARAHLVRDHGHLAKVLSRRSQKGRLTWKKMLRLLERFPLPPLWRASAPILCSRSTPPCGPSRPGGRRRLPRGSPDCGFSTPRSTPVSACLSATPSMTGVKFAQCGTGLVTSTRGTSLSTSSRCRRTSRADHPTISIRSEEGWILGCPAP
jgi:hypothetical protein